MRERREREERRGEERRVITSRWLMVCLGLVDDRLV